MYKLSPEFLELSFPILAVFTESELLRALELSEHDHCRKRVGRKLLRHPVRPEHFKELYGKRPPVPFLAFAPVEKHSAPTGQRVEP
jgi:hypothetical protein